LCPGGDLLCKINFFEARTEWVWMQGIVAQGRTIQETLKIAPDVAKKPMEVQSGAGVSKQACS
jgi:hypothetical protein